MMESVVMECNGKNAVVLKKDGTFSKIPNLSYTRGERIELTEKKSLRAGLLLAAACMCLVLGLGSAAAGMWFTPYSHVGVSAGYEVDFTLNRFEYVIDVDVRNDERSVLSERFQKEIKNKEVADAVAETLSQSAGKDAAQVTVFSKKEKEQKKLMGMLEETTSVEQVQGNRMQIRPSAVEDAEQSQVRAEKEIATSEILIEEDKNEMMVKDAAGAEMQGSTGDAAEEIANIPEETAGASEKEDSVEAGTGVSEEKDAEDAAGTSEEGDGAQNGAGIPEEENGAENGTGTSGEDAQERAGVLEDGNDAQESAGALEEGDGAENDI